MDFVNRLIARWHAFRRVDVVAFLLLAVLVAAVLAVYVRFPFGVGNWGFGPDWECISPGQGDPVCTKKPMPATPDGRG
jgi:hypothetical protein